MLRLRVLQNLLKGSRCLHSIPSQVKSTPPSILSLTEDLAVKCSINFAVQKPLYPTTNKKIEDFPIKNIIIESPRNSMLNEIKDIISNDKAIETPGHNTSDEVIQAVRMIVIRRHKMRKHKLKKLRKRMKFEWAKVRQRRELRKEKAFQAVLIAQIKEAEKFSAEQYVADKLKALNTVPIPRLWKGKRLPQFIIKEKLGIK
ncbi:hypothetical protein ACFFRR_011145 [Megaselia abdita]